MLEVLLGNEGKWIGMAKNWTLKIKVPDTLPDYIEQDDIEKLKNAMRSKKLTRTSLKETYLLLNLELKLD
jgi:hypothetical protein